MMMQAPAGQFLLLTLDTELHPSRVTGIFHNVALLPGVQSVQDLSTVPLEHLAERILLRVPPEQWPQGLSPYNAIRQYWQRKRQPRLL